MISYVLGLLGVVGAGWLYVSFVMRAVFGL